MQSSSIFAKSSVISSVDSNYNTAYVYGQDGQRTNKYTANSETLYFNKMWTLHTDSGNNIYGGQTAKNIYLGETRIVTKLNSGRDPKYQEEYYKQYYYHSDHLGSASLISDYKGEEYQRIEYTPYGEIWVEKTDPNTNLNFLPYKFTAKEMDEETGLYYYGARYLDAKYSRWLSTDPALGEYIPAAGKGMADEAGKLPGVGGAFNSVNLNLYHYAGNNPVRYTDPDGKKLTLTVDKKTQTMNIKMEIRICGVRISVNETVKVTTHVIANSDSTQPNKKANENLNPEKRNDNGSAWTQFPNGEWNITGSKNTPQQNADVYCEEQLRTDAHQILPKRDSDGNILYKEDGTQQTVDDGGYNIHFTPYSNTAGCIGVKDKSSMKFLMQLFKLNEKFDPNSSKIIVTGVEE